MAHSNSQTSGCKFHDLYHLLIVYIRFRDRPRVVLTIDIEQDSLGYGRRDVVGGDAEVGAHLVTLHFPHAQRRAPEHSHCRAKREGEHLGRNTQYSTYVYILEWNRGISVFP